MSIPSGKGRNGDVSISSILLKRRNNFLPALAGVYHSTAAKQCSPTATESRKSIPLDSPTVFSKHDILIHGSLFTLCLTGGRQASPDRHDRKETIACPPKTTSTRWRRRSPRRRSRDLRTRNEAR